MDSFADKLNVLTDEKRLYMLQTMPKHLAQAGQDERLRKILMTFDFLQTKLDVTDPHALIVDINFLSDDYDLGLIQSAIRMSSHGLASDPSQFPGQLIGRLFSYFPTSALEGGTKRNGG